MSRPTFFALFLTSLIPKIRLPLSALIEPLIKTVNLWSLPLTLFFTAWLLPTPFSIALEFN
jgi:hypothetical protein